MGSKRPDAFAIAFGDAEFDECFTFLDHIHAFDKPIGTSETCVPDTHVVPTHATPAGETAMAFIAQEFAPEQNEFPPVVIAHSAPLQDGAIAPSEQGDENMSDASNWPDQEDASATSPSKRTPRRKDRNDKTRDPKFKSKTAPVDKTKIEVIEERKHKIEVVERQMVGAFQHRYPIARVCSFVVSVCRCRSGTFSYLHVTRSCRVSLLIMCRCRMYAMAQIGVFVALCLFLGL